MRYAPGHKDQTRAKILRAAGIAFRRQGYHATGVDKVMEEAGLTAGGFYAHFESKEALLAEALAPAAAEAGAALNKGLEDASGQRVIDAFVESYLSPRHRGQTAEGCPLPALVSEVARTGESVKASFESIIRRLAESVRVRADGEITEDRALAIIALCVGGLGIARSVRSKAVGERILVACRDLAKTATATDPSTPSKPARKRKPT
jgi:TetR/AcrR family transcriptional regulator, transcriptional repressor for nem operon